LKVEKLFWDITLHHWQLTSCNWLNRLPCCG